GARGVLAAIELEHGASGASGPTAARDRPDFASLNRELFRGDLAPWKDVSGAASETAARPDPRSPGAARVEIDPSLPGRLALEHFFDRSPKLREDGPRLHLFYLDAPIHDLDSLALGVAAQVRAAFS